MITLTAEALCDSCGKVCGVGEPNARSSDSQRSVSDKGYWATSAIDNAEAKARSHGAQINIATVTCAECLEKERNKTTMKNNLGMGVMINMLAGNEETVAAVNSSLGKRIKDLTQNGEELHFEFDDGTALDVWDDGQSCCEHRYMVIDDKLGEFIGSELKGFEVKEAPPLPYDDGDHEVQFLDVHTSKGTFQAASHNEHNGYYGGFSIKARATRPPTTT